MGAPAASAPQLGQGANMSTPAEPQGPAQKCGWRLEHRKPGAVAQQLDLKVKGRIRADPTLLCLLSSSAAGEGQGRYPGVCSGKVGVPMIEWQGHHTCELWQPESPPWGRAGGLRA